MSDSNIGPYPPGTTSAEGFASYSVCMMTLEQEPGAFLMITTLPVLRSIFRLRDEALARIEREAAGGICRVFLSQPNLLHVTRITIIRVG